jgi:hypothetical protein
MKYARTLWIPLKIKLTNCGHYGKKKGTI